MIGKQFLYIILIEIVGNKECVSKIGMPDAYYPIVFPLPATSMKFSFSELAAR